MSNKVKVNNDITYEKLKSLLTYDPNTGIFIYNYRHGAWALKGSEAGRCDKDGYLIITINKKAYSAHRLAWLYMTGEHPKEFIDHKDGNKSNNKFENLREATSQENNRNRGLRSDNTTGYIGVQKTKNNTFSAVVKYNGKNKKLGTYKTPEEASEVREKYVKNFYGQFYKEGILEK